MDNPHYREATAALAFARAARVELDNAFSGPFRDNAKINDLQAKVGFAMKSADVHSNLAIAHEIHQLRDTPALALYEGVGVREAG